ncbi:MAG: DUF6580 family putative transport protein [Bacteroidales bacterium]
MRNNWFSPKMLLAYAAVLLVIAWRVFTEIPNFTPVMALAFFGGAYFGKKHIALILPFSAMIISDLILGLHATMLYVYVAFALAVGVGVWLRNRLSVWSIIGGALGSSVIFFVLTNLGVWITGMVGYPMNVGGLMACYTAAIPFFRTEVISTLVFSGVFFGAYYAMKSYSRSFASA